jgi:hypothetical protein
VDFPEGESVEKYKLQDVEKFGDFIERRENVPITGGLTDTLPGAVKFTKSDYPPGLVLHIDPDEVRSRLEPIQYDIDWFDANPGVLAHVTTLRDGELREDGRISALLDVKDDKITVDEYRRAEVKNEATASRYTTEREVIAFDDEIHLDGSIKAMAVYLGTSGTSPYTLARTLDLAPKYTNALGTVKNRKTGEVIGQSDDYEALAAELYDDLGDFIDYDDAPLYIVAVKSRNDVRAEHGRITPENFRFVYNGRSFDRDYTRNSRLLGGA